ncbi:MAG: carboxypeptidase regulatory-like domain-containing protein, partial [Planctomycetota bacterium]|nr:carboxypeptidase regulatory-like domain-containing protein [Planctomycetota bacterium]
MFAVERVPGSTGAEAPAAASPEKLVGLLEKGDFDERQNAVKQLEALGEKARKALETAAEQSETLEVRETAQRLLNGLSSASLLIEVLDRKGRPIAGAELEAAVVPQPPLGSQHQYVEPEERKPLQLRSDAAGRIRLERVSPGPVSLGFTWKHLQVSAAAQALSMAYLRPGENRLQYILQRGGTVSGRAMTADGDKPLAGATVALVPDTGQEALRLDPDRTCLNPDNDTTELHAAADAAGEFTIERVPPGSFLIFAQHQDYVTVCGGTVRVGDETRVTAGPLKLAARAAAWGGIKALLLNDKGEPLKDAKLQATVTRLPKGPDAAAELAAMKELLNSSVCDSRQREGPRECSTDGSGYVELKDLRPGTYRVVVRLAEDNDDKMRKYMLGEVVVTAGKSTTVPGRKPAALGSIAGRVAGSPGSRHRELNVWALPMDDPEAALVVGELKAHALWFQNWNDEPDFTASADNDGKFELSRLLPGRYTLAVWRDSELVGLIHGVEVAAGKAAKTPDLELAAAQQRRTEIDVGGTVFLPDGQPAEGARVTLVFEPG